MITLEDYDSLARKQIYNKQKLRPLVVKYETVTDTERETILIVWFDDGAIVKLSVRDEGGNCWDVSSTIYKQEFIKEPSPNS